MLSLYYVQLIIYKHYFIHASGWYFLDWASFNKNYIYCEQDYEIKFVRKKKPDPVV